MYLRLNVAAAALLVLLSTWMAAGQEIWVEQVRFATGTTSASLSGSIEGYDTVEYKFDAGSGQVMRIDFRPGNASAYFNLFAPGSGPGDQALFIGPSEGNELEQRLATGGTYTVQVYLYGNAARRQERSDYTIEIGIDAGSRSALRGRVGNDARVPGTRFHATGKIACSFEGAAAVSQCDFGVIRHSGSSAIVEVTFPDGFKRTLRFDGARVSVDEAAELTSSRQADSTWVEVDGKETFNVPDALLYGG